MAFPFVDIHSHTFRKSTTDCITITDCLSETGKLSAGMKYSMGIHPWYADSGPDVSFLTHASQEDCIFIGECGLDRLQGPTLKTQTDVFIAQLEVAKRLSKPVLIHCVRAFDEMLRAAADYLPHFPMVIHGYNLKSDKGIKLIETGFYLSFGTHLFKKHSAASDTLSLCPTERIFLETDDSEAGIETVYHAAAGILNTETEKLKEIIFRNYMEVTAHA